MFLTKILSNRTVLLLLTIIIVSIVLLVKNQDSGDLFSRDDYKPSPNQPLELPGSITSDFPVYPDATVLRITTKPSSELSIGFASKDSPQKVFTFLLEKAGENGWQIIEQKELVFRSTKDKTTITISISQNPGEKTAILEQVKIVNSINP